MLTEGNNDMSSIDGNLLSQGIDDYHFFKSIFIFNVFKKRIYIPSVRFVLKNIVTHLMHG